MRQPLVEQSMDDKHANVGLSPRPREDEAGKARPSALRKAELRRSIEASTARILSIALSRDAVDPDPEVA